MTENHILECAKRYMDQGLTPIPIKPHSKMPVHDDWHSLPITKENLHEYFTDPNQNIGIILKDGIADVDLDCEEAIRLARHFLPATGMIFGRATAAASHWIYKLTGNAKYAKFSPPKAKNEPDSTIVELRAPRQKHQTVFPPSIHATTKEQIRWYDCPIENAPITPGVPTTVTAETLHKAVSRLAAAVLISRGWKEGARQDATMALAGGLAKAGWQFDEAASFIKGVLIAAFDTDDVGSRLAAAKKTFEKFETGDAVTGWTTLGEHIGDSVVGKACAWLHVANTEQPLVERDGRIFHRKMTKGGYQDEPVTSFAMRPLRSVFVPGEGEYLECLLKTEAKDFNCSLAPSAWVSAARFKGALAVYGSKETTYLGNDNQTQMLRAFMASFEMPHVSGTRVAGFHKGSDGWRFVTEEGALGARHGQFHTDEDYVFINETKSNNILVTAEPLTSELRDRLAPLLSDFNDPTLVAPLLGWIAAAFYKDLLMKWGEGFPVLIIEGGAGSGKTQSALNIIMKTWGIDSQPKSIAKQTAFTLMKHVSISNVIPLVFDENKKSRQNKQIQNLLSGMIRDLYNGIEGDRGQRNQSLLHYKHDTPTVICGESGFNEAAISDRTVVLQFSKRKSEPHREVFQTLRQLPLVHLGRALLEKRLSVDPEGLRDEFLDCMAAVHSDLQDRPRVNAAVCRFGLRRLTEVLGEGFKVDPSMVDMTVLGTIDPEYTPGESYDAAVHRRSEISKMIETFSLMSQFQESISGEREYIYRQALKEGIHYSFSTREPHIIKLHITAIIPLFRDWARQHEYDGDILGTHDFMKQLRDEPYYLKKGTINLSQTRRAQGVVLDMSKMTDLGLTLEYPWFNPSPEEE